MFGLPTTLQHKSYPLWLFLLPAHLGWGLNGVTADNDGRGGGGGGRGRKEEDDEQDYLV